MIANPNIGDSGVAMENTDSAWWQGVAVGLLPLIATLMIAIAILVYIVQNDKKRKTERIHRVALTSEVMDPNGGRQAQQIATEVRVANVANRTGSTENLITEDIGRESSAGSSAGSRRSATRRRREATLESQRRSINSNTDAISSTSEATEEETTMIGQMRRRMDELHAYIREREERNNITVEQARISSGANRDMYTSAGAAHVQGMNSEQHNGISIQPQTYTTQQHSANMQTNLGQARYANGQTHIGSSACRQQSELRNTSHVLQFATNIFKRSGSRAEDK